MKCINPPKFALFISILSLVSIEGRLSSSAQTNVYTVSTFAGSPLAGPGTNDGAANAARFNFPEGVAVDKFGNLFIADCNNHTIRKMTSEGIVTTLAGSSGHPGSSDGNGAMARFLYPSGVAVDNSKNIFVANRLNHTIRRLTYQGVVTTIAGLAGKQGSQDGTGANARFNFPSDIAVDRSGNLFVTDEGGKTIRKISPTGVVTTFAGLAGSPGSADGTGGTARFNNPFGIAINTLGNLFVTDNLNDTIRKITPSAVVTTIAGSAGKAGSVDGTGTNALFDQPVGIAVDRTGNVFVGDCTASILNNFDNNIREIAPGNIVTTVAGSTDMIGYSDGTGTNALFHQPFGIAIDTLGNIFIADQQNCTIRKGWLAGTPPIVSLDTPTIASGQIQIPFALLTGVAPSFTLLQIGLLGGSWNTNLSAALTTNVPGVSYNFSLPVGGTPAVFFRVQTP